ncbi:MAG: exonuclease domain-containing protein [Burkholderiales bacterium]
MLEQSLVFLDLETTGATPTSDRITEIGLVEVENGELRGTWSQLVNPEARIPPFIESLTGITSAMVENQPTFAQIAPQLFERLQGKILIAHNARFDYGFLRNEFLRLGLTYRAKVLCTVKLSRALYPMHRRHNLDSLIERHGLTCDARHRALGDALVLWQFVRKIYQELDTASIHAAVAKQYSQPSLPARLPAEALEELPESPGVYLFYGESNLPIYIGKSVDLRARVWSHFSGDHKSGKDMRISQEVVRVEWIQTAGELGALLKEAKLIKEMLPALNRMERRQSGYYGFERDPKLDSARPLKLVASGTLEATRLENLIGLFRSKSAALAALTGIAAEHGLCPGLLGLEPPRAANAPCFAHQIKRCRGACCGKEGLPAHNLRLFEALQAIRIKEWPYDGPIGLRERGEQRSEIHVFDRWCYLGSADEETKIYDVLEVRSAPSFDLDIYRIVERELRKRRKGLDLIQFGALASSWYRSEAASAPA